MKEIAKFFKAFSEEARLRIFGMLAGGSEVCVCKFTEVLKTTNSKISRHLAYLKKCGLVSCRRYGTWKHYKIVSPKKGLYASVYKAMAAEILEMSQVKKDIKKMNSLQQLPACSDDQAPKRRATRSVK